MKYQRIVFMQGQDADEPLSIYNNEGASALLSYLSQWDHPGDFHETFDEIAAGTSDRIIQVGDYIMTINSRLNYCGLERIINP